MADLIPLHVTDEQPASCVSKKERKHSRQEKKKEKQCKHCDARMYVFLPERQQERQQEKREQRCCVCHVELGKEKIQYCCHLECCVCIWCRNVMYDSPYHFSMHDKCLGEMNWFFITMAMRRSSSLAIQSIMSYINNPQFYPIIPVHCRRIMMETLREMYISCNVMIFQSKPVATALDIELDA